MQRLFFASLLFALSTGTASADYVIIKINLNKLDFFPMAGAGAGLMGGAGGAGIMGGGGSGDMPPGGIMGGAGGAGFMGSGGAGLMGGAGFGGMPPGEGGGGGDNRGARGGDGGGGQPGGNPMGQGMDDPDAKWISAFVEFKGKITPVGGSPATGMIFQADHKWGKKNWLTASPKFPITYGNYIPSEGFNKEFDTKLNKEKMAKSKNVENFLHLARFALSRGQLKEFHRAMKEAGDVDAKHPVVLTYQKVQKELSKPFNSEDPSQTELIRELKADKFEPYLSEQKHYCLYAQFYKTDRHTEAVVKRRLAMMEETLETFYYWFAVQKVEAGKAPVQPKLPKHRLMAILSTGKEEFLTRHEQWGSLPMVGDGFTPRRDNFIVLSAKSRITDPLYTEFDKVLTAKIQEANVVLQALRMSISREDLLTGKTNEVKGAGNAALYIGAAQASVLLAKTMEEDAERGTITNEAIRQLLIASDMFPRNVQVPDWIVEGLAAFFETSPGSIYPTIGRPSWLHLVSFKHLTKGKQKEAPSILFNVVTDRYFRDARKLSAELNENRENDDLRIANAEAWEMARSTAWSFVYYLSQNHKLDMLFQYGKELDNLPRDMDLSDTVMQGGFAQAFAMADPKNPRRIAPTQLSNMAISWFNTMDETNLDILKAQSYLLEERAKREPAKKPDVPVSSNTPKKGGTIGINPKGNGGSTTPPMPMPMDPGPMPMPMNPAPMPMPMNPAPMPPNAGGGGQTNLAGSRWTGTETFKGQTKLTFQLGAGGQATMFDLEGVTQGNYESNGNSITLRFAGTVTYTGTLNGTTMSGNATNGMSNWTWTVSNANAGGTQIQPMPQFPPKQPNQKFPPKKKGPFG